MKKPNYKALLAAAAKRRQRIKDFAASGKTTDQVAARFRITRGRAWQIIADYKRK